ncbi:MAG: AsmA-like C-terminal region-containing protein [Bacteroidales bacterium]
MKKFLKIFIISLVVLIVLLVATIVLVPVLFKDKIMILVKEQINENVNAKVDFKSFDLSLIRSFPDMSVSIGKLSVVGIDAFEGDTLLAFKELYVGLDLMSIIKGETYQIKTILLDAPVINGIVRADSTANWDIAKPTPADTTLTEETPTTEETGTFKMKLKKLEIRNANITYTDKTSDLFAEIKNLNYILTGDFTADVTDISMKLFIDSLTTKMGSIAYLNKTKLSYDATILADLKASKYTFKENVLKLNALELSMDGWVEMPDTQNINMDLKISAPKTEFKSILSLVPGVFMEGFENIKTAGNMKLDIVTNGTFNSYIEQYPLFDVKLLVENASFQYPQLPKGISNIGIDLQIYNKATVLDSMIIDLKRFHVEFAENPFDITLLLKTPMSDPDIACMLKGVLALGSMKDFIPMENANLTGTIKTDLEVKARQSLIDKQQYEQVTAKGHVNITDFNYTSQDFPQGMTINESSVEFTPQYVLLKSFDSKIGQSDIQMNGLLENFIPYALSDGTLKGNLTLTSKYFDTNEFMSEDSTSEPTTTDAQVQNTQASSASEPVEVPKNIDFTMITSMDKVLYDKLEITNLKGLIVVRNGKADMQNLSMNLLNGSLKMSGYYSTEDITKPEINFNMDLSQCDIQKTVTSLSMVKDMAPIAEKCYGTYSTKFSITSLVDGEFMPIYSTTNGKGNLKATKLEMKGSKMQEKLSDVIKREDFKSIIIDKIDFMFEIVNGRIELKPFTTKLNGNETKIWGSSGLDQTIDYTISTVLPTGALGAAANQAIGGLLSSAGISSPIGDKIDIDFLLTGTIDDTKVNMRLGKSSQSAAGNVTGQVKEKLKEELNKQKEEAERLAREQAERAKAEADKAKAEADKAKQEAEEKAKAEVEAQKKKLENEVKSNIKNPLKK